MVRDIETIGIIGSGKLGTDIFNLLVSQNLQVVLICFDQHAEESARSAFNKKLSRQLKSGIIDQKAFDKIISDIKIGCSYNLLEPCDVIIECIWENKEEKKKLFKDILPYCKSDSILASNSSSIVPSMIIHDAEILHRFVGLHFFYPVSIKNFVEIIFNESTSAETIKSIKDFAEAIGKTPLLQAESKAFALNRLFLEVQLVAFEIQQKNDISCRTIDQVAEAHLFPGGIFSFFDSVGLDVMLASIGNYNKILGEEKYKGLIDYLQVMVDNGWLGKKSGKGFYDYSGNTPIETERPESAINADALVNLLIESYYSSAMNLVSTFGYSESFIDQICMDYTGADLGPFEIYKQ